MLQWATLLAACPSLHELIHHDADDEHHDCAVTMLLAGQVGISGHLTIHDNAVIYAQSGIGGDVKAGAVMSGSPAFDARDWLRAITAFQKLPELLKTVRQLEKRLEKLQDVQGPSQ